MSPCIVRSCTHTRTLKVARKTCMHCSTTFLPPLSRVAISVLVIRNQGVSRRPLIVTGASMRVCVGLGVGFRAEGEIRQGRRQGARATYWHCAGRMAQDWLFTVALFAQHSWRALQHTAQWSQSALNIRPTPGKSWFKVGPCGGSITTTFSNTTSRAWIFLLNLNTNPCSIEALETCIMFCLHLARVVLPAISPIAAHRTTGFVKECGQISIDKIVGLAI